MRRVQRKTSSSLSGLRGEQECWRVPDGTRLHVASATKASGPLFSSFAAPTPTPPHTDMNFTRLQELHPATGGGFSPW